MSEDFNRNRAEVQREIDAALGGQAERSELLRSNSERSGACPRAASHANSPHGPLAESVDEVDREVDESLEALATRFPNLSGRGQHGRRLVKKEAPASPLTPEQRLLLLDTWRRSGLPAGDFAALGRRLQAHAVCLEEAVRHRGAGRADGPATRSHKRAAACPS